MAFCPVAFCPDPILQSPQHRAVAVLPNNQLALVELNQGFVEERKSSAWDRFDRHFIHIQISLCHCWSRILYVATPDDEIIRETTAGAHATQ